MSFEAIVTLGTGFMIFYTCLFSFCLVAAGYLIKPYAYVFSFAFFAFNLVMMAWLAGTLDGGSALLLIVAALIAFTKFVWDFSISMDL
jgi:hypothetical protein